MLSAEFMGSLHWGNSLSHLQHACNMREVPGRWGRERPKEVTPPPARKSAPTLPFQGLPGEGEASSRRSCASNRPEHATVLWTVSPKPHCQMFPAELAIRQATRQRECSNLPRGVR